MSATTHVRRAISGFFEVKRAVERLNSTLEHLVSRGEAKWLVNEGKKRVLIIFSEGGISRVQLQIMCIHSKIKFYDPEAMSEYERIFCDAELEV